MWSKQRNRLMAIGHAISHFPLFAYEAQWVYLFAALIAPWILDKWVYCRFFLFFYFVALSLISRTLSIIVEKKRKRPVALIDYSRVKPEWFMLLLLKDKARPEVLRSIVGMGVLASFLGGFSVELMEWGFIVALFVAIFMIWYLWQDNFSG